MTKPFFDMTFFYRYTWKMVKRKLQLRVKRPLNMFGKPNWKAEAIVQVKKINQKFLQFDEAVAWCKEHKKEDMLLCKQGCFLLLKIEGPLILSQMKKLIAKKEHLQILTLDEECSKQMASRSFKEASWWSNCWCFKKLETIVTRKIVVTTKFIKLSQNAQGVIKTKSNLFTD